MQYQENRLYDALVVESALFFLKISGKSGLPNLASWQNTHYLMD